MKGITKSLFASQARVRSAMADAAQASMDTLGYARGDSASAIDADAAASAFRRGDDGACEPGASLVLVLEHAVGFDEPSVFLAARVLSAAGGLKGARALTLAARRDDDEFITSRLNGFDDDTICNSVRRDVTLHDDTEVAESTNVMTSLEKESKGARLTSRRSAHVFNCRRDLRVFPAPGDSLLIEAYAGNDTSRKSTAWSTKCVARGLVSLEHLLRESDESGHYFVEATTGQKNATREKESGKSVRAPLHRALLNGEAEVLPPYVSLRVLNGVSGSDVHRSSLLTTADENTDRSLGSLIDLDLGSQSPSRTLRVSAKTFPKTRKRVFFVRHGESRWNEAQREMQLSAMAKFDHPLNAKGAEQAVHAGREAARYHAASLRYGGDAADASSPSSSFSSMDPATRKHIAWSRSFGDATRCLSSPLTRAAQTAALFLFASGALAKSTGAEKKNAPDVRDSCERFVVLSRSLREVKSTMGSLDTIGIERGSGIWNRAAEKLRDACHGGCQPDAAYADAAIFKTRLVTDFNDAFGQWWTSRDDVDSREAIDERVDDFFETLRLSDDGAVIVVGHSLWFQHAVRKLCRREGSKAFVERETDLARKLASEKIGNCACVGVDVAFDARTGEASIEDAAFLFGSGDKEGGGEDDS